MKLYFVIMRIVQVHFTWFICHNSKITVLLRSNIVYDKHYYNHVQYFERWCWKSRSRRGKQDLYRNTKLIFNRKHQSSMFKLRAARCINNFSQKHSQSLWDVFYISSFILIWKLLLFIENGIALSYLNVSIYL